MPCYFFHVHDGRDIADEEGTELPDLDAVRTKAIRASGEMLRGRKGSASFWAGDDWTMTAADEVDVPVLTLRFSGTMHG